MKNKINYLLTLVLVALGLGVSSSAWGYEDFYEVYMTYSYNEKDGHYTYKKGDKDHATVALGTLTENFVINTMYLKFNDDYSTGRGDNPHGQMGYKINGGSDQWFGNNTWNKVWGSKDNNHEFQNTACNLTIGNINGNSGNYTFEHWYQMWWNSTNKYVNNDGTNYKFTYTILPPAVSNFTVLGSGADLKSGNGTEENPYIILGGGSFTLTANCDKAHADDNSHRRYKFGDAAYSSTATKTISNVTNTEVQTIEVKACSKNETDNLSGEESTKTIYYKAEPSYTISVVSENTSKGTVDKSEVIAYQYGQADNSITATPKAGYDFAAWTKSAEGITINSPSSATTTLKSTTDGTVTATFTHKTPGVSFDAESADYKIGGAAIKLNPTYTNLADDATYTWTGTNVTFTPSANVANPNVSSTAEGGHTVTITVSQGGKNANASITLNVTTATDKCATCFPHTAQ